jgi:hypothetical protein
MLGFFRYWLDIPALSVVTEMCSTYAEGIIDAGLVVEQGIRF